MRFGVGYVSCGLVVLHLLVNLGIMSFSSFKQIKLRIQYKILKCKHSRAMKLKKRHEYAKKAFEAKIVPITLETYGP